MSIKASFQTDMRLKEALIKDLLGFSGGRTLFSGSR